MYDISVVVPVYNTEKYIKKCLDSLVNQTMKNIEIIVINDGSTDRSEDIIIEYEKKYPELIKYFKKENGGLSSARNYGVQKALGNYISFVDSDDYVDRELFNNLKKYLDRKIDIIKFKTKKIYESGKIEIYDGPIFEICNGEEAFNRLCFTDKLLEPAWLYLYKREFWIKNKFEYSEGLYHEDFGLTPVVMINAKTVTSTNIYGYYYIERQNSIVKDKTKNTKKAYDLLKHYDNMVESIEDKKYNIETINNLKQYYSNAIIRKLKELKSKEKRKYKKEIKSRKLVSNIKPKNIKQVIKKIVLKIIIQY